MPKQRLTCTECSMRRQKCDRNIPCSRCVKRGDADKCTREWPKEGYDPKRHRIYPRPDKEHDDDAENSDSFHSPTSQTQAIADLSPGSSSQPSLAARAEARTSTRDHAARSAAGQDGDNTNQNVLSFIAWGRTPLSNLGINSIELGKEPAPDPSTDWNYSNGFGGTIASQVSFLQMLVPDRRRLQYLVDYHISSVHWYHGVTHGPTLQQEYEQNSKGPNGIQLAELDLRWAAKLFAMMASSMACAKEHITLGWGFSKAERAKLTRQWFKATLSCLNLADYMWKHHVWSAQAICILSMSAHILGFSNTQSTLMGAAFKICQGLGLQRLGPEEDDFIGNVPTDIHKTIKVETGRRVWSQICIQDWFSIPFSEMYSIQKHHFTTTPPRNLDEKTMTLVADDLPSLSSYQRNLQALARVMADAHDAVLLATTAYDKYEQVMLFDNRINNWLAELPVCLRFDQPLDPSWPPWIVWARRSALICAAHKIMMIHRNFLGRSFSEPSFSYTRDACIQAAKTILQQIKASLQDEGPILWIDQAYMVASGITLSLDIFHRKVTDPAYNEHRKLVENDIIMLTKVEDSMIAARGIRLLSSLLTEQARTMATQSLDNYNRSKRLRETEMGSGNMGPNSGSSMGAAGMGSPIVLPLPGSMQPNKRPRQRFDVPRFVESLGQGDPFAALLRGSSSQQKQDSQNGNNAHHENADKNNSINSSRRRERERERERRSSSGFPTDHETRPSSMGGYSLFQSQSQSQSASPYVVHTPPANSRAVHHHDHEQESISGQEAQIQQSLALARGGPGSHSRLYAPSGSGSGGIGPDANANANANTATVTNTGDGNAMGKDNLTSIINTLGDNSATTINDSNMPVTSLSSSTTTTTASMPYTTGLDLGYETFEQLFPPQTGISNVFLFEDLLNFDF